MSHPLFDENQIEAWQEELLNLLNPFKLAAWLARSKGQVVGFAADSHSCPVQQFINDHLPHLDVRVGHCGIWTDFNRTTPTLYYFGGDSGEEMPEWLQNFIAAIDTKFFEQTEIYRMVQTGMFGSFDHYQYFVLAEDALSLLYESIPQLRGRPGRFKVEAVTLSSVIYKEKGETFHTANAIPLLFRKHWELEQKAINANPRLKRLYNRRLRAIARGLCRL